MQNAVYLMPEFTLLLTLCGVVLAEWTHYGEKTRWLTGMALTGFAAAGLQTVLVYPNEPTGIFNNQMVLDGMAFYFKLVFIALGALTVLVVHGSGEIMSSRRAEFIGMVVAATLALSLVASATHLLLMYLAIQFVQFLAYFMSGYTKQSLASAEASMKFFMFSLVSSLFFLFAVSVLFSVGKTINLLELRQVMHTGVLQPGTGLILFGLLFLSVSFFLGSFPMHLWVADVFDGSPTPSSLFLSMGIPAMGIIVILRFFSAIQVGQGGLEAVHWSSMVGFVAVVTMLYGAWMACLQTHFRRLFAYLIMARTGFLILGLMVPAEKALSAIMVNISIDLFSVAGIYFITSRMMDWLKSDSLNVWREKATEALFEKIVLLVLLGSFLGLPPFPGFFGKFLLLSAVVEAQGYYWVIFALTALLVTTIAFVKVATGLLMVSQQEHPRSNRVLPTLKWERAVILALLLPGVWMVFSTGPILLWARATVAPILW